MNVKIFTEIRVSGRGSFHLGGIGALVRRGKVLKQKVSGDCREGAGLGQKAPPQRQPPPEGAIEADFWIKERRKGVD